MLRMGQVIITHKFRGPNYNEETTDGAGTVHVYFIIILNRAILFIIRLCTNKIALKFTLLKQHIKIIVLF